MEHPVTEMVSDGIDLVHGMIEVAAGKGIPREYMAKLGDQTGMSEEEKEGLSVPHHGKISYLEKRLNKICSRNIILFILSFRF